MRRTLFAAGAVAALVLLALASFASAADLEFTPSGSFELSDTKVGGNPSIKIHLEQEDGEEEMAHVTLVIPKGFGLPSDKAIPHGEPLGTADLSIASGPACAGAGPVKAPASFPDRQIIEQDRTDEQKDRGVKAVWKVDLEPVTRINLEVTGSRARGWKLDGDIPANQFTCPPLVFDGEILDKTADGVKILRNPKPLCASCNYRTGPGTYAFKAIFTSQDSPTTTVVKTPIQITN